MQQAHHVSLLIEDIYGTIGDDGRWPPVLRSLRACCNAATCAVASYDFEARTGALPCAVGIDEAYRSSYRRRYAALNPWLRREECYRRVGAIWAGQTLVPHRKLVASEFYRDWLKPQDLYHRSCAVLRWRNAEARYLELLRPAAAGPFDRREIESCRVLVPHLSQALALAELLEADLARVRGLGETIGRSAGALMVLERDERLLAVSPEAERLLASGDTVRARNGHLRLGPGPDAEGFHREVGAALRTASGEGITPGGEVALHDRADGGGVTAKIIPLPQGTLPGQDQPAAAVVLDHRLPSEERLQRLYELTPAEARLAVLLARGVSPQAAAERLGIALSTVRTHLQRIYDKTETNRQPQLVALLLGVAGRDHPDR